ncbi:YncE family protein [Mucilaginibacter litoreus]|uniref:YncE family protein n=1 Tax=Mucilaginibacter litoreus TaxID=1048221 RepID=A0ABW3AT65_9SPHI
MNKLKLRSFITAAALTVAFTSCHKDRVEPNPVNPVAERAGVYILNEGSFNQNNSTLTYYDYTTKVAIDDIFSKVNSRGLGDTGNDAQIYGSKMYITVNVSSTLEVLNAKTARSIKQIKMDDNGTDRQPRYVVFNKNKAFISSYDGTIAVLDTASLTIEKYIKVGRNPEQMVIANGKLYVANSGGLDLDTPDKTVSVIDLNTLTETKKIEVPANPTTISADGFGDVYVVSYGNYSASPKLTIIDNKTDVVKNTKDIDLGYGSEFLVSGDVAYYYSDAKKIKVYDVKTETVKTKSFISGNVTLAIPYSLAIDNNTGELFVGDAVSYTGSSGLLYAFDKTGKMEYSVKTGINPGAIVLVNK